MDDIHDSEGSITGQYLPASERSDAGHAPHRQRQSLLLRGRPREPLSI